MEPPPPTTGQTTPSTPPPVSTTNPTPIHELKPTNPTLHTSTQTEHTFSYHPSSTVPPFSSFFPTSGQSPSSQQIPPPQFQPNSSIVHTTSTFQPPLQPGLQYQQPQFLQTIGARRDGYDDGYEEEFAGYEEEGYVQGQRTQGFVRPQQQQVMQQIVPQQLPQQGLQFQRQIPQQQQQMGQMFQPRPQQFAPQRPVQRPMGPPHPSVRLGVPRRNNREAVRGIEAHFRPIITNNPSLVVIPQNQQGMALEVRTNSLQSLPKYKGLAMEEPYFHLEAMILYATLSVG
ncbi:probable serine/threonine-protein kinase DDB_G0281745 [Helianthus annuus]|uniref:probable serine/threonine-protein kinase DDB_G0281745 n=1 Tax=Helianthus annuus TaxID=4232 RepID=UPI000B8FCA13|nr:probable serine/threonine-protein kinase DDB_G0281745 [Helianthus annuus]